MGDPLSMVAGVAGLLSLGIQVSESLIDFYKSYRDQDADIAATTDRLKTLQTLFALWSEPSQSCKFDAHDKELLVEIGNSILSRDDLISELQ